MKQIILTAFFLGVSASSAITTYGCWCGGRDVNDSFKQARAVFAGEVVDITEPLTTDEKAAPPGRFFTIKFKVEKSWKGVPFFAREFSVLSAQGHYGCFAYPPVSKGERYLVYADPAYSDAEQTGWNIMTICNRTSPIRLDLRYWPDIDPYHDMRRLDVMMFSSFRFDSSRRR